MNRLTGQTTFEQVAAIWESFSSVGVQNDTSRSLIANGSCERITGTDGTGDSSSFGNFGITIMIKARDDLDQRVSAEDLVSHMLIPMG